MRRQLSRQAPAAAPERLCPAAVGRRDEAVRQVPVDREGEAHRRQGVPLGPPARSDPAAAQEDPTREDPPEEDQEAPPRLSRRAAVVKGLDVGEASLVYTFYHPQRTTQKSLNPQSNVLLRVLPGLRPGEGRFLR
jgi:hypothetical protein